MYSYNKYLQNIHKQQNKFLNIHIKFFRQEFDPISYKKNIKYFYNMSATQFCFPFINKFKTLH